MTSAKKRTFLSVAVGGLILSAAVALSACAAGTTGSGRFNASGSGYYSGSVNGQYGYHQNGTGGYGHGGQNGGGYNHDRNSYGH